LSESDELVESKTLVDRVGIPIPVPRKRGGA